MSATTLSRGRQGQAWEVPTGILRHDAPHAESADLKFWPDAAGGAPPSYLHPAVVAIAAAGSAWFLLAFWITLGGDSLTAYLLAIATLISCLTLGLLLVGSEGRNVVPWQRHWRSFHEFLAGHVDVWGARVSGREAFIQIAGLAWCLAALATTFAVIIAAEHP